MKYGIESGVGDYFFRSSQCTVVSCKSTRMLKNWVNEDPLNRIIVKRTAHVSDGARNFSVASVAIPPRRARGLMPVPRSEFMAAQMSLQESAA
jgi:hypothetical protein